jgi:hypothetical protein
MVTLQFIFQVNPPNTPPAPVPYLTFLTHSTFGMELYSRSYRKSETGKTIAAEKTRVIKGTNREYRDLSKHRGG